MHKPKRWNQKVNTKTTLSGLNENSTEQNKKLTLPAYVYSKFDSSCDLYGNYLVIGSCCAIHCDQCELNQLAVYTKTLYWLPANNEISGRKIILK